MPSNLVVLQARMSSSRLPGKVLLEVDGKPLLAYQIERLKRISNIDELILATSRDETDDKLEAFAKQYDVKLYRGSLDDVLSRYYHCAHEYKQKHNLDELNIIRVTGDCPILDINVCESVIKSFLDNTSDYTSNTLIPTFPDGLDIEVFTFDALKQAYHQATLKSEREHVTLYIKNSSQFEKQNVAADVDFSHLRLTVDEGKDFTLVKELIKELYSITPYFDYFTVIALLTKRPHLLFLNSDIQRDEGLVKSLQQDGLFDE